MAKTRKPDKQPARRRKTLVDPASMSVHGRRMLEGIARTGRFTASARRELEQTEEGRRILALPKAPPRGDALAAGSLPSEPDKRSLAALLPFLEGLQRNESTRRLRAARQRDPDLEWLIQTYGPVRSAGDLSRLIDRVRQMKAEVDAAPPSSDSLAVAVGKRLVRAREGLGLSQQAVHVRGW